MNLDLLKNITKDAKSNISEFLNDLNDFLDNNKEYKTSTPEKEIPNATSRELNENRKEGHLYLVTEDRNNKIYLWDFTEKSKDEFEEIITDEDLLAVAKEGAMLQYKNGKYELYSKYGFDIVEQEK